MATKKNRPEASTPPLDTGTAGGEFQIVEETIKKGLDPHLQEVLLKERANQVQNRSLVSESDAGEAVVDVIAKVKDPAQDVPGLNVVRKIGEILTGTVAIADLEAVRSHPNIVSLKRATEVHYDLRFSVPEIGANQATLRQAFGTARPAITGRGVIVGVVDFDLDFQHRNFRNADGSSRILFLWDQQAPSNSMSPAGFGFGREFTQARINAALATADPYGALGYEPQPEAHGTHVTDIAAGNGQATGNPGVAPEADIIFVQLHGGDVTEDQSFGNSKTLLEAADYIFGKARELQRPCVINMSLGTHGGPHDGTTLAEQGFDQLLRESGRAIVISAGNSFLRSSHASGTLNGGETRQLGWRIRAGDRTDNELEVWYPGERSLSVSLISPAGSRIGPVQPGTTVTIQQQGRPSGTIISRVNDPNNGFNQVNITLRAVMPTGDWMLELTNTGASAVTFDAWIERDDEGQSRFAAIDDERKCTIGSISCGHKTIVVGSYQPTVTQRDISNFSSSGPTRDGREKPEVSAPGDMIRAAASLTQGAVVMSGTSMAAPHVTGLVALTMQAAGVTLTCDQVREIVMSHARRNPPAGSEWDPRFGIGRIDAVGTIRTALPAMPGPPVESVVDEGRLSDERETEPNGYGSFEHLLAQVVSVAGRMDSRVSIHIEVEPARSGRSSSSNS